jgi:hypothetical protein
MNIHAIQTGSVRIKLPTPAGAEPAHCMKDSGFASVPAEIA